jgi:hypothetical protein
MTSTLPPSITSLVNLLASYKADNKVIQESSLLKNNVELNKIENELEKQTSTSSLRECKRLLEEEEVRINNRLKRCRLELRDLKSISESLNNAATTTTTTTTTSTLPTNSSNNPTKSKRQLLQQQVIELRRELLLFVKTQYPVEKPPEFDGGDFWDAVIAACSNNMNLAEDVSEIQHSMKEDNNEIINPTIIEFSDSESPYVELLLQLGLIERAGKSITMNQFRLCWEIFGELA